MFWSSGETPEEDSQVEEQRTGPIEVERDAARPATILRVASELEARGAEIQELFKEITSPLGEVVLPIHLLREGREFFVEVETGPWDRRTVDAAINKAAIVRNSEYVGAGLEIVSAYPVDGEVAFFFGRSPAALLQLALFGLNVSDPEASAERFREVASVHWGVELDYDTGYLPLAEELLQAALDGEESPPILDALVGGLGCFVGEIIRRNASPPGSWRRAEDWSEGPVVEFDEFVLDPVGKSRAFLLGGPEDSVAFYANFVLEQLSGRPSEQSPPPPADL